MGHWQLAPTVAQSLLLVWQLVGPFDSIASVGARPLASMTVRVSVCGFVSRVHHTLVVVGA